MSDTATIQEEGGGLSRWQKVAAIAVAAVTVLLFLGATLRVAAGAGAAATAVQVKVEAAARDAADARRDNVRQDSAIAQIRAEMKLRADSTDRHLDRIETNTCITVAALTHTSPEPCRSR